MKKLKLESLTIWLLLAVLGLIVIHAPLTVFIGSRFASIAEPIKAWKEILITLTLVLVLVDYYRQNAWKLIIRDKLLWLIAGFALIHVLVIALHGQFDNSVRAGLMIDLRYLAYSAVVYGFIKLYPKYAMRFYKVAFVGAVIVIGFTLVQLVLPRDFLTVLGYGDSTIQPYMTVDKNPMFVRQNSTLRGPNPLGAYAVMVLVAVVAGSALARRKFDSKRFNYWLMFFAVGGAVALAVSYSRSAWLGAGLAVAVCYLTIYRDKISASKLAIVGAVLLVLAGGLYIARDNALISNVILHNNPDSSSPQDSNQGHYESLVAGVDNSLAKPLGAGVGSTGSASLASDQPIIIENQYLFVSHEIGWFGLAIYLAILFVVFRRLWRTKRDWIAIAVFSSGIGLLLIGLMLPVFVDDTVSIVWWGLASVVLASKKELSHGKKTNQKAKRTA